MSPTLSPEITLRLARIRMLLDRADSASREPAPFAADSVNRLHDVAETFLALACEYTNATIPREFEKFWSNLGSSLNRGLGHRVGMARVNRVRVNLKHHGIEPSAEQIEHARATVRALIEDECPAIFGVDLSDITMSDMVNVEAAKRYLTSAERYWREGDAVAAFADLSSAFDDAIEDYLRRKRVGFRRRSVFATVDDDPFRRLERSIGATPQAGRNLMTVFQDLDRAILLLSLGIDRRKHARFKTLTPSVARMMGGRRTADWRGRFDRSEHDYNFCRDFVIETSLHLAAFDYEVGPPPDWCEELSSRDLDEPPDDS